MVSVDALVLPADVAIQSGPLPLSDAVTPDGPETDTETVWAKLPNDDTYRFTEPDDPCGIDTLVPESASEKSPGAVCAATPLNEKEATVINNRAANMVET